jgi:hypothetical protein
MTRLRPWKRVKKQPAADSGLSLWVLIDSECSVNLRSNVPRNMYQRVFGLKGAIARAFHMIECSLKGLDELFSETKFTRSSSARLAYGLIEHHFVA